MGHGELDIRICLVVDMDGRVYEFVGFEFENTGEPAPTRFATRS